MEKRFLAAAALALMGFTAPQTASASCYWQGCAETAFGFADAGGFAGTAMSGRWTSTDAAQFGDASSEASTDPARASSRAGLSQETGGFALGREVYGDLFMYGETAASAVAGRRGAGASTDTEGTGVLYGGGTGKSVHAVGSLYGASEQGSAAVAGRKGAAAGGAAHQFTSGYVGVTSSGRNQATAEGGVTTTAAAAVD